MQSEAACEFLPGRYQPREFISGAHGDANAFRLDARPLRAIADQNLALLQMSAHSRGGVIQLAKNKIGGGLPRTHAGNRREALQHDVALVGNESKSLLCVFTIRNR